MGSRLEWRYEGEPCSSTARATRLSVKCSQESRATALLHQSKMSINAHTFDPPPDGPVSERINVRVELRTLSMLTYALQVSC
jgi:hypothetical protein